MPQLVKQGKWVFGWVLINERNEILIPPEAYVEYGFIEEERVVITRGSKSSGGFGIAREELLKNSILNKTRSITTTQMGTSGKIKLPSVLDINPGDRLLVCRGSYLALGFLKFGPIVLEAQKHSDLEVFCQ